MSDSNITGDWRARGDAHLLRGDADQADLMYHRAARATVRDAATMRAAEALCAGRAAEAEGRLKALVRANQGDIVALNLLALTAIKLNRLVEAEAVLHHCLEIAPDDGQARHTLATLFYTQDRYVAAVPLFAWLLTKAPHDFNLRKLLATCLMRCGDDANSIPQYEYLLASNRAQPDIWLLYGHALKAVGRQADAARAYRACIGLEPSPAAYLSLAELKTADFSAAEIDAMRRAIARPGWAAMEQAQLHYALGRGLELQQDYAGAFRHFAEGAKLRRGLIDFDADRTSAAFARTKNLFTPEFFAARKGSGSADRAPIFVLGLARSGSTLVEQILASHKAIEGTHEMTEIGIIAGELGHGAGAEHTEYPGTVAALDEAALLQLGERYLRRAATFRRTNRPFFIDKMPDNFRHIGLIHAILPNARILDVRRTRPAAGLAVFKQFFQPGQPGQNYTYDLAEIRRFYDDYVDLMRHFDTVLPGRIHLVRYEELVADTEPVVRAMLDYLGLDFDPACLRFWQTERSVQTPSAQQVRRPIFREGLEHWRNYEAWVKDVLF